MTKPTHFNCPHCTYAYQPGDPRFAVPKGKASRVMACPACGGAIRVRAPGTSSVGNYILIAIVIAIVVAYFLY